MEIKITKVEKRKPIPEDDMALGFGKVFTDHMFLMEYEDGAWKNPRIEPYHQLRLDPAAMGLHYGQEVFEGLKGYRGAGGGIYLFRPDRNIERMNRSNRRLMMPEIPPDLHLDAIKTLVLLERDWIPKTEGCALYIRPTMIATDPFLGVRPSNTYVFYIIVGPVAAYYPEGFNPVSIYTTDKYVRAVRGGVGDAKTAGNYAASLAAQIDAIKAGYTQVLWLDAIEQKYIEEVGTMNIMFKIAGETITSPLTGSILPGITRDSVITLGRDLGYEVSEAPVDVNEMLKDVQSGKISEVFGCGTAAVIAPVGKFGYLDEEYLINDYQVGPVAEHLYQELTDLQYGRIEDRFNWIHTIEAA